MNPVLDACLRSWPWDPWLTAGLALTAVVYFRGWLTSRRRDPSRFGAAQLNAFLSGLIAVFLALASPIETFSFYLLQVHMLQHLLLMMAAPPLLWLGRPMMPILRGLPRPIRRVWIGPLVGSPRVRRFFGILTHPIPAWIVYVGATWLWHIPSLYDLALTSPAWHYVQHACFLFTALVFWYPVVRPYPARPGWSRWWLLPYLILADVQNTVLSALLTFSSRVVYQHYETVPRLGGVTALDDQASAGVLMWVPGSVAFLLPLFGIGLSLMFRPVPRQRIPLTVLSDARNRNDLLDLPVVGPFLKWKHSRVAIQAPLMIVAIVLVIDGFLGPPSGAMNLAGVVPWVHWRGLLIVSLLAVGNVFCFACPFTLSRTFARKLRPPTWNWPPILRNKWLAVGLIVVFFWAYEAFSLWDSPWLTAWIILAYFAAAFAIDVLFRGAAFCKFVCPIGQFNFVQSMVSPVEVAVRDPAVCERCETKDCIRGVGDIPGCEMRLFQPRKSSNLDCTFCLDCVHACPHDNIGLLTTTPGSATWTDPHRSGLGRLSRRLDVAALVVTLTFAAFVNAAMMTGPALAWRDRLPLSPMMATAFVCLMGMVVLPVALMSFAAMLTRVGTEDARVVASRFSFSLIPLGFSMWLAHYGFHLITTFGAIVPTTQRFLGDFGIPWFGTPVWACCCCAPPAAWLLRLEIVVLDIGLAASLYSAYRIAESVAPARPLRAVAPWAAILMALFAAGVWIVFQPMEMRGLGGG